MIIEDNYNKKIAPFIFDTDLEEINPVNIDVSVDILELLKFIEVDLEYILKFKLKLEWYDYRLTYWNLKTRRSANRLSEEEFDRLWMPYLIFKNTEKNEATIKDAEAEVTLTREGNFTRSEDSIIEEINIFNGIDNKIIFDKVYTKTFRCEYQLQLYCFDTQVKLSILGACNHVFTLQKCLVEIVVPTLDQYGVVITPKNIVMKGQTVLTQYIVPHWQLRYRNESK